MNASHHADIELSAPGASSDLIFTTTQQLIAELNREAGPVALRPTVPAAAEPGAKGDLVSVGQIAIALISAGITKQIAQILMAFIKRNPRYVLQVGKIKITKDHASANEVEMINSLVKELASKSERQK